MSFTVYFFVAVVATITIALFAQRWVARKKENRDSLPVVQIGTFFIVVLGLAAMIVFFPTEWLPIPPEKLEADFDWEVKQALLGFLGVVISAAIAISASSLLGNAFAGFMIRSLRNIRNGAFVRIDPYFGKVSERGLLHLEVETDSGELITLPNLFVISQPIEVLPSREERRSVKVQVAIGYHVHRSKVARLLKNAAERAGLKYPMVIILELGDYSVAYEARGFIPRKNDILTMVARSKFLAMILDVFHEAGIEVLSPEIGVSRDAVRPQAIPEGPPPPAKKSKDEPSPESLLYEKASKAENTDQLRERLQELQDMIKAVKTDYDHAWEKERREQLKSRLAKLREMRSSLQEQLEEADS